MKLTKPRLILSLVCVLALLFLAASHLFNVREETQKQNSMKRPPIFMGSIGASELREDEALLKPVDVFKYNDLIYVLDSSAAAIKVYDASGRFERKIKISSDTANAQPYPVGMDIDGSSGTIFVAEIHSQRILKYTSEGRFSGYLPKRDGQIKKPVSVTWNDGFLYVSDAGSQSIKVFEVKSHRLVKEFGTQGGGPGQFFFPTGISVQANGDIYVADSNNKRVQLFNAKGQVKAILHHNKSDIFGLPRDIAADRIGSIHVVDAFSHKVNVFNSKGNFSYDYGEDGSQRGLLEIPNSIFIDNERLEILIADPGARQVFIYGYEEV